MSRSSPICRSAFTLIELLMVISILAILVALLVPSLGRAKALAREVTCRSNISQLNQAHRLYTAAAKGEFFCYNGTIYMDFLEKYHKIDEIRLCPMASKPFGNYASRGGNLNAWNAWSCLGSYAMNGWIYNPKDFYLTPSNTNAGGKGFGCCLNRPFPGSWWLGIGDVGYPGMTPSFADSNWVDAWPWWDDLVVNVYDGSITDPNERFEMCRLFLDRHRMGINVGFLDGHVDYVPLGKLWSLMWSKLHQPSDKNVP